MISRLAVKEDRLVLLADTLLGQPLFRIEYDKGYELRHAPADAGVKPDWLIAMLQFAYADADAVNGALRGAELEENGARRIVRRRQVLVEIVESEGVTEIRLPGQALHVRVQRLNPESRP
jgi:hypothetical protein